MTDLAGLQADLAAEQADLDSRLAALPPAAWDTPTPAAGWTIRDTVSHLAFFDEQAALAAGDPETFRAGLARITDLAGFLDEGPARGRRLPPGGVLAWWREARTAAAAALAAAAPGARLPWFGPEMSLASFVTARLMETWAHGQDVADALRVRREPTHRLRHVCFLGVRALPNSYRAHGREVPDVPVRVELTAPDGACWAWGNAGAVDWVRGPALDFALLVTQRRHRDDLALTADGPVADEWLWIAQAFAGPPGAGRARGMPPA